MSYFTILFLFANISAVHLLSWMGIILVFTLDRLNIRCQKKNSMFNSNEGEVSIIFRGQQFFENYRYCSTDEGVMLLALPENLEQLELVLFCLCVVPQLECLPYSSRHVHHSILGLSPFQWLIISKNSATDQQDNIQHVILCTDTLNINIYCFQIVKLCPLIFFNCKILNNMYVVWLKS